MKTKIVLSFFAALLLLTCVANAQVVYETKWKSDADVQVFVTEWKSDADLIVYTTTWKSDAQNKNEGIWFFTEWKSDAKKQIYFTT